MAGLILTTAAPTIIDGSRRWKVTGPVEMDDQIIADWNALPACVQQTADEKLRRVIITRKWDERLDATSFKNGNMILAWRGKHLLDTAFLHEVGHYYDWATGLSTMAAWHEALDADFAAMTPEQRHDAEYIHSSQELAAELFAAHFLGKRYFLADHYQVQLFTHSMPILKKCLCDAE